MKPIMLVMLCVLCAGSIFSQKQNAYDGKTKGDSTYSDWKGWIGTEEYQKYNYEVYFMPGAGYAYYELEDRDSVGSYSGIAVDYLLWAKSHQNKDFGPSHVKVYMRFNLNKSTKSDMGKLFYYTAGIQCSIEKNPKRNYLIPFFGAEMGGISQREFGTTLAFQPLAGIYLVSNKNIFVNVFGGYLYPVRHFDYLSGYSVQASVNFALW